MAWMRSFGARKAHRNERRGGRACWVTERRAARDSAGAVLVWPFVGSPVDGPARLYPRPSPGRDTQPRGADKKSPAEETTGRLGKEDQASAGVRGSYSGPLMLTVKSSRPAITQPRDVPESAGAAMPEKNGDACGAANFREETSKKAAARSRTALLRRTK